MSEAAQENDGRLSFDEAVAFVARERRHAFAAAPVFGERTDDENQAAEGVRLFLLEPAGEGGWQLRFIAGPFFSTALGANEIIAPVDVPERVRAMRFMPTRCEEAWFDEQIQVLIQRLAQAANGAAEQMPDYASQPERGAGAATVFPVSFVGRGESR